MTRTLGISLVLAVFALACSPPSPEQIDAAFHKGCVRGCTQSGGAQSIDCDIYCDCTTAKLKEHRTDEQFSQFIRAASYNPPPEITNEVMKVAQMCVAKQMSR